MYCQMNNFTTPLRLCSPRPMLRCLFALILIFSFLQSTGQLSDYNFVNFDNRDGLSSNSVNAILKDHAGYMWFGTDDGLNKFDGSRFEVYHHSPGDTNSIPSNKISALCEDGDGNLWIGTSRSLSLYDRKRNLFLNTNITMGNAVRTIYADQSGNIWVGSYMGLLRYNHKKGELQHFVADGKPGSLRSGTVSCVLKDRKGVPTRGCTCTSLKQIHFMFLRQQTFPARSAITTSKPWWRMPPAIYGSEHWRAG